MTLFRINSVWLSMSKVVILFNSILTKNAFLHGRDQPSKQSSHAQARLALRNVLVQTVHDVLGMSSCVMAKLTAQKMKFSVKVIKF